MRTYTHTHISARGICFIGSLDWAGSACNADLPIEFSYFSYIEICFVATLFATKCCVSGRL